MSTSAKHFKIKGFQNGFVTRAHVEEECACDVILSIDFRTELSDKERVLIVDLAMQSYC